MPLSPARVAAFEILLRVDRTDAYATELLHAPQHESLSTKDHGLATEIVMGVLRWRSALDRQIAKRCSQKLEKLDPEVLVALRMGAYQLEFLDRVPDRAAIHESVELVKKAKKRSASGLVNAVLRKLAAAKQSREKLSELDANPEWLVTRWTKEFGPNACQKICSYNQTVPDASVRIYDASAQKELADAGIQTTPGLMLSSANRIKCGNVTATPAFQDGRVAIQDEASQLVALLVGKGERILDCCAAPGGKTRLIAAQNPNANVVALELHDHRAQLLRKRMPEKNVQIITADATKFTADHPFDRVLVDAPCSGTGTLTHNPEIKWRLKPEDLPDLHRRQLTILQSAMKLTAAGGRLIFATCSLEPEENASVVSEALSNDSSFRLTDCKAALESLRANGDLAWNDLNSMLSGPYLRTIPGVHPCDGFFAAILQRG